MFRTFRLTSKLTICMLYAAFWRTLPPGDKTIRYENRSAPTDQFRVNQRIRIPRIRVIGDDGVQLGILDTSEALRLAKEKGLDLVEVSPKAVPPVCKIMDYGKFKYELSKKEREERAKRTVIEIKEIKFRPKTDGHDFTFKVKHIREFLTEGNKVRLVVQFRGREIMHPDVGQAMLRRVVEACAEVGQIEQAPSMEGKKMNAVLAPRPGQKPAAPKPSPVASTASIESSIEVPLVS